MKKLFTLVVVSFFAVAVFGQNVIETQNAFIQSKAHRTVNMSAAKAIDTLFMNDFFSLGGGYYNLGVTNATGWIFGSYVYHTAGTNHAVGDEGAIQWGLGFPVIPGNPFKITGAVMWLAGKGGVASNSSMTFSIHALDDSSHYGNTTTSYDIVCPGTELGSTVVNWADLDTTAGQWGVATFATPVPNINFDFACVWDVDNFYTNADSIGIVGADGGSTFLGGDEYVWMLYSLAEASSGNDHSGDFWTQMSHVWSYTTIGNVAPAVFPITDDATGVNEYFNGIKLGQNFPNPVVDGHTTINYAIENASNVTFMLWDMNGRVITEINEGFKTAGEYTIVLDQELSAGTYIYSLGTDDNRLTKNLIVQ